MKEEWHSLVTHMNGGGGSSLHGTVLDSTPQLKKKSKKKGRLE
jgi:hypothetical protein